jgi:hypothetical protein
MRADKSFRINTPNVINEIIDGEAVIVNLETGIYYSIDKIGALIWSFIENEMPVGQIIDTIADRCDGSREAVGNGVNQLVAQLREEELIVRAGAREPGDGAYPQPAVGPPAHRFPFENPVLHKYNDMEGLLLLDPIHEVDGEMGWPTPNPDKE